MSFGLYNFSKNADANNSASPNGFPEFMAPSGINNSARKLMSDIATELYLRSGQITSTGDTDDEYELDSGENISSLPTGLIIVFKAHKNANNANTFITLDGIKKQIKGLNDSALRKNEIVSNKFYQIIYDGTNWNLLNPSVVDTISYKNTWSATSIYEKGNFVFYDSKVYMAKLNIDPASATTPDSDNTNWLNLDSDTIFYQGDWSSSNNYKKGQRVSYNNEFYVAASDHNASSTTPPDSSNWELTTASQGTDATDTTIFQGDWASTNGYDEGDIVEYSNEFYICNATHNSPSSVPSSNPLTNHWQLLTVAANHNHDSDYIEQGDVTAIVDVATLPNNPNSTTMYLVDE